ncbi:MAG: hypothetical protein ACI3YB_05630 [Prevotella sp.]
MKLFTLFASLWAVSLTASAQYINQAAGNGFDINGGKDYIVLYAPEAQISAMGSKITTNNNLDPTETKNYLEYWVCDWDKSQLTLYNVPEEGGKNSWGGSDYINATPLWDWGTGVFMPKNGNTYDLSRVTNNHHLHIGLRDWGSDPSQYKLQIGSQETIKNNGFLLEVGLDRAEADGDFVGVGTIAGGNDGKWYYLDIPVADLVDPMGDFGFKYNFSDPIKDGVFAFSFSNPKCSDYKYGAPAPGETMKSVEIVKLGSALSIDHVFFYVPETNAIENIGSDNDNAVEAVYDMSGRRAEMNRPGIYIVKTANGTKKVVKK